MVKVQVWDVSSELERGHDLYQMIPSHCHLLRVCCTYMAKHVLISYLHYAITENGRPPTMLRTKMRDCIGIAHQEQETTLHFLCVYTILD
jgi:hypothetical protein